MQARHDIDYPLWNMMYYFVDNLKDLLFGFGIYDPNPTFVMSRFDETTTRKSYMVSYNKKRYDSYNQARADSQLFNGKPDDILS